MWFNQCIKLRELTAIVPLKPVVLPPSSPRRLKDVPENLYEFLLYKLPGSAENHSPCSPLYRKALFFLTNCQTRASDILSPPRPTKPTVNAGTFMFSRSKRDPDRAAAASNCPGFGQVCICDRHVQHHVLHELNGLQCPCCRKQEWQCSAPDHKLRPFPSSSSLTTLHPQPRNLPAGSMPLW